MNKSIFNSDIIVHTQAVRGIHYSTQFGEDLDFDDPEKVEYDCSYDLLTHKENKRDHILIMELSINPIGSSAEENDICHFHIIVEGHYEVNDHVENKMIERTKHVEGLSLLLSFLRTSLTNITSLTHSGRFDLPLIQLEELHNRYNKEWEAKHGKSKKKSKAKKTGNSSSKAKN